MEPIVGFLEALMKDTDLQVLAAKADDAEAFVALGAERGFQFTVEEALRARNAVMEVFDRSDDEIAQFLEGDELGERDLEAVAGGTDAFLDLNGLVQSAMRKTYVDQMQELQYTADKVSYFNDQKQSTRDYLSSLRATASSSG